VEPWSSPGGGGAASLQPFLTPCCFLAGQLSTDDLNSLIAHAHRRIDQLNKELAEQRVREQQHIELALEKQKLEDKKALEAAVAKALEHHKSEIEIEQEKKVKWWKSPRRRAQGAAGCSECWGTSGWGPLPMLSTEGRL